MRKAPAIVILLLALAAPGTVFASTTVGTITSPSYAWSSNDGWINFGATQGHISVGGSNLTGYAWGQNIGWINLAPNQGGVMNDGAGHLSGYAWGQDTGWINFSGVTINSSGKFTGAASGPLIGTLNFDCSSCNVTTDWRPSSVSNSGGSGGGGGLSQSGDVGQALPSSGSGGSTTVQPVPSAPTTSTQPVSLPTTEPQPVAPTTPPPSAPAAGGSGSPVTPAPAYVFPRTLSLGAKGLDVQKLQQFLNTHGFVIATKGAGSPGHETQLFGSGMKVALKKYQVANAKRMFKDGKTSNANGVFGPSTRAFVNAKTKAEGWIGTSTATQAPAPAPTPTFTRTLSVGSSGKDVLALQQFLNTHGFVIATKGAGSPGHETQTFGASLKAALTKYQIANAKTMFADGKASNANGVFGPSTRAFVNAVIRSETAK